MTSIFSAFCIRHTALFLLFGFFFLSLHAQESTPTEDVIFLKNGSVIRGKLLEYQLDGNTRIETVGRNVLVFPSSEVSHLSVEPLAPPKATQSQNTRFKDRGYYNLTQIGLLLRNPGADAYSQENTQAANLQMVNGYRFHRLLYAGVGVGLSFFQRGYSLPVFGELRGDILHAEVTPHYYVNAGYSFPLYNGETIYWEEANAKVKGGVLVDAGVGVKIHTTGAVAWLLTAGYRMQRSENEYTDPWSETRITETYTHRRLSVQLGMLF